MVIDKKAASDRFGNRIDATVGYARGRILSSSYEEALKLAHARLLIRDRIISHGQNAVSVFTGNQREFPLLPSDLDSLAEEGPGRQCSGLS